MDGAIWISNDLDWPITQISRAHHYSTLNISATAVQVRHSYIGILVERNLCPTQCVILNELGWFSKIINDMEHHVVYVRQLSCLSPLDAVKHDDHRRKIPPNSGGGSWPFPLPSLSSLTLPSPLPSPLLRSRAPQIQLGGLGERCKLPQRGLGQSHSRNRI